MACMCGDSECRSCGVAQGTLDELTAGIDAALLELIERGEVEVMPRRDGEEAKYRLTAKGMAAAETLVASAKERP